MRLDERIDRIIRDVLKESIEEDKNRYIPKKVFNMVNKLNAELRSLKEMTGEEYPELLDTSTGSEVFFYIIDEIVIDDGCMVWTEKGNSYFDYDEISEERINLVRYDDDEGYWFDEYEYKDAVKYIRSGIRKAIKYFKEYDPEWDDDDNKRDEFIGSL